MFGIFRQIFCNHEWIYGRVASREARGLLKWAVYHNRACTKCSKVDNAADRAEEEATRILQLRGRIGKYPDAVDIRIQLEDQHKDGERK